MLRDWLAKVFLSATVVQGSEGATILPWEMPLSLRGVSCFAFVE